MAYQLHELPKIPSLKSVIERILVPIINGGILAKESGDLVSRTTVDDTGLIADDKIHLLHTSAL